MLLNMFLIINQNYIMKLFYLSVFLLFFFNSKAQHNVNEDCSIPATFLVGEYTISDVEATTGPDNDTSNFEPGIVTLSGEGTARTFQSRVLPAFLIDFQDVVLNLNCGIFQLGDLDPGLQCTAGTPYIFSSTTEDQSSSYTIEGSDDFFVINYIEDPNGSCGGPFLSSFSLTKVCSQPQNIQFNDLTESSVEINWLDTNNTTDSGNSYDIEYGLEGFDPGTGEVITGITGDSATITNLQTNVVYDFYIVSSCSNGEDVTTDPLQHEIRSINNPDFYLSNNGGTCMCPEANFGDSGTLTIDGNTRTFTKRSREQLDLLILNDQQDPEIALTCTSGITNMSMLFGNANNFNSDINSWDVSNVTDMSSMFLNAYIFDQPLNRWDVSNVTDMTFMFFDAYNFDQSLNNWDVSSVTSMRGLFGAGGEPNDQTIFNQSLNNWDVSSVTDMAAMFQNNKNFNQPLDNWDVSNVIEMRFMFAAAAIDGVEKQTIFNQPINNWDVSNVNTMNSMFQNNVNFDQPLNNWDVSNVTSMRWMFFGATSFNQSIGIWDVAAVTDMGLMFSGATSFDQPLDNWDVSNVTDMDFMFRNAFSFNQDISDWCVEFIPVEPEDFSLNSPLVEDFKPDWGAECENLSTADRFSGLNLKLYPNPVSNQLFIENSTAVFISGLTIYNIQGQLVQELNIDNSDTNSIDVSKLAAGNYFLKISTSDHNQVTKRFVKK